MREGISEEFLGVVTGKEGYLCRKPGKLVMSLMLLSLALLLPASNYKCQGHEVKIDFERNETCLGICSQCTDV